MSDPDFHKGYVDGYRAGLEGATVILDKSAPRPYIEGHAAGLRAHLPGVSAGREVKGVRYVARVTHLDGSETTLRPRRTRQKAHNSTEPLRGAIHGYTVGTVAWQAHA